MLFSHVFALYPALGCSLLKTFWQVKHCMLMQVQTGQSGSPSRQVLTLQCVPQADRLEFGPEKGCHIRLTKVEACNLESKESTVMDMAMAMAVIVTTCYCITWSSIRDRIPCASASVSSS
jgi:hypothetical protein